MSIIPRVGLGSDLHRLVPGRDLILLGIKIPSKVGLLGHSDADVATHALIDALIGAAAAGDIGEWFPDSDPAYKDANSIKLLQITWDKLRAMGYEIGNIDIVITAEKPKLSPYKAAMSQNIAKVLNIAANQVNVKAKTNEGLGYLGRMEGIAAEAVVLLTKDCHE